MGEREGQFVPPEAFEGGIERTGSLGETQIELEPAKDFSEQRQEFVARQVQEAENVLAASETSTEDREAMLETVRREAASLFEREWVYQAARLTRDQREFLARADNPYNFMSMSPEEKMKLYELQSLVGDVREKMRSEGMI